MRLWLLLVLAAGCRMNFDPLASRDAPTSDASNLCGGLAPTCGPTGDQPCCGDVLVPGGTFARSYDMAADALFPDNTNTATISPFRLDRYEVTVGRFRQFVDAGFGTQTSLPAQDTGLHPNLPGSGWQSTWNGDLATDRSQLDVELACSNFPSWTPTPGANEALPINCVTWYEAMAFCIWDGGYLPTEAEWNFAAAGGPDQRAYPWSAPATSTTIDCTLADFSGCGPGPSTAGAHSTAGNGAWGNADLAGNVWEWALDYTATSYTKPCADCADLTSGGARVVRGGSFVSTESNLRAAERFQYAPTSHNDNVGFRCARPST